MEKLITVTSKKQIQELIEYLRDKEYVSFDTETTGVTDEAEIIGYSMCAESGVGYYVATLYWDKDQSRLLSFGLKEETILLMNTLLSKSLIMHNGLFDIGMVKRNYGVDLTPALHTDTMILAHLLDENRRVGLKELGAAFYGSCARKEQEEMKASVLANGGQLTKDCYELYKADASLIAKYGAKDAILTYNLFHEFVPELYEEGLDKFFYEDESMPLLKGPTQDLNTTGLKVDHEKLALLKKSLEIEIMEAQEFINREIQEYVQKDYPGTTKKSKFNIGSGQQLSWLLFEKLGNVFPRLSDTGRELCKALGGKVPYTNADKKVLIQELKTRKDEEWRAAGQIWDPKTRKYKGKAKIRDYWTYLATDKAVLAEFSKKYKWVARLLEQKKAEKLLSNYVEGIQKEMQYGVIKPNFLQHGTTSGRYSCRKPNFQNLPRKDKRVKSCIIARPGKVFVGADYDQLEPRVFASFAGDHRLLKCFSDGDDFYSIIGAEVYDKDDCTLKKDDNDPEFFGNKYSKLRDISKVVALSATYGTTAFKMASAIGKSVEEAQHVIDTYFQKFPQVKELMEESHKQAKENGFVINLFGRPRRMPKARDIEEMYGDLDHNALPYEARNLLNLAVNHRIQSTGASIMNRAAILFYIHVRDCALSEAIWDQVKIVLQVHDQLVAEAPKSIAEDVAALLKFCMETAVVLPGVALTTTPKIGSNLAEL